MNSPRAAIVTGASRGIGRQISTALANDGIEVGLIARNHEALRALAAELNAPVSNVNDSIHDVSHSRVHFAVADVSDANAVELAVEELATRFTSPIGLLVNNAGVIDREVPLWEADVNEWRQLIETNLVGSFNVSRAVIPRMLEVGGGRVIEIVSGAGAKDWGKASAYVASKAAMIRNVGHLHEAGFDLGLRSFALAPGTVRTDMSTSMDLHRDRTEFTPVELTTDMVLAMHRGELDEWSGKYLRVTHDSPQSLRQWAEQHGAPPQHARRLTITPWGDDDPQVVESLVPKQG